MSCLAILLLTAVIMYFGALIAFFLAAQAVAMIILALVVIPLVLLLTWRIIYPWLVRIGRWAAQTRNLVFLAFVLTAVGMGLGYIVDAPTVPLLGIDVSVLVLVSGLFFLFLLLLAMMVWLVRLLRRWWPTSRDLFWDIGFRAGALLAKIFLGIPLGVTWFLYRPPLRWLVATLIFYLRGIGAGAAWVLYNPPLRNMAAWGLFATRLIVWPVALVLYNPLARAFVLASASVAVILGTQRLGIPIPPIGIIIFLALLWPVPAMLFVLRLLARSLSTIVYGIASWWPIKGVRGTLKRGLIVESKSYQDYQYA